MKNTYPILFSKMHGLGNDFMVIDAINQSIDITALSLPTLAHRHIGIGFDQLLLIDTSKEADFSCRIFNADGSEAEQCGNGLRCVARFINDKKLISQTSFSIETQAGVFAVSIAHQHLIEVAMGKPYFEPERVPFIKP